MLESIRLKDFISHKDTTISFGNGVTIFIGRNGSGKSSVIDGVTYALYGKHTRSSNRNLIRHGAQQSSVVLEFSINTKRYKVERRMTQRGNLDAAVLYELKDGSWKPLAMGERRQFEESISNEIARILGLDYEKMRIAAIIQQGEIDRIVEYSPKEFKELVNSIIGIDRLDNAYRLMRDVIDGFRERLRKVYGYDDNSIDTLSKDAERYERDVEMIRQKIAMVEEEMNRVMEKKVALEREYKEMRLKRERFESIKVQVSNLLKYMEERRKALEKEVADIKATLSKAEEYLALVEHEGDIRASLDDDEKRIYELDEEINKLKQEQARLEALKQLLENKSDVLSRVKEQVKVVERLKHIPEELSTLRARLQEVNINISSRNEEIGKLRGLMECASRLEFKDNICPVCGSRVERINPLFEKHMLEKHLQDITRDLSRLGNEKADLEGRMKRLEMDSERLQRARGFLEMHRITSIDDLNALEEEVSSMGREVEGIDAIKRKMSDLTTEKNATSSNLERYKKRLEEINRARAFLDAKGIESRSTLEQLEADLKRREASLARLKILLQRKDVQALVLSITTSATRMDEYAIDEYSSTLVREIEALADECKGFSEDRYSMLERMLEEVGKEERDKDNELVSLKSRLDDLNNDLEELRDTLELLEDARRYINILSRIRDNVFHRDGPVARSLRSWALQQISEKASEYARSFAMGISRIELREEEKRSEVGISCYGTRGLIDIASMSGGEKVAIALALRFAIAYVMGGYKLDFIIMDEPTVHLDEERRASIVELIGLLAEGSTLKQIIMVTHDSEIFEDADVDHLYRFEMTDDGTLVSEVR